MTATKKATFLKYKDRRSKSDKDIHEEEQQYLVEDAKDQLQLDVKETGRELTRARRNLTDQYGANPLNSQNILEAEDDVEALTLGVKRLKGLTQG